MGPVVAGFLIATGRYDLAFMTAGVVAMAVPFMAASWPSKPRSSDAHYAPPRFAEFTQGIAEVARQPLILMTSAAQGAQFVLNGTLNAFLPLFARDVVGFSPTELGWLFGLQTVITLSTRPIMGMLADRVGRRAVIVTGLTLCTGAVFLVASARTGPALVVAIVLYAIGVAVTTAATSAYITDLARRARYGAAHGVFGAIYDVGDALGPIAPGVLVAAVGYTRMFQIMAAVAITVAVLFAVVSRHAPTGTPPAPA
jgi:MFS family permease